MPTATFDFLAMSVAPLNIPTAFGTLLCTPALDTLVVTASSPFSVRIPADCTFVGVSLCFQGASWDGTFPMDETAVQLTNALDITLGTL